MTYKQHYMSTIIELLHKRILVLDGAMGTMLQRYNFSELDFEVIDFEIIISL